MIWAAQGTPAGDTLRRLNRPTWRMFHRLERIAAREAAKAFIDVAIYGTGFVRTGADVPDFVAHIPYQEIFR